LAEAHDVNEIIWLDPSPARSEQRASLARLASQIELSV
jgi:hypothetical protein